MDEYLNGWLWIISPMTEGATLPPLPEGVTLLGNFDDDAGPGYIVFTEDEYKPDVGEDWIVEQLCYEAPIPRDAFYKQISKGVFVKDIYALTDDASLVDAISAILARRK